MIKTKVRKFVLDHSATRELFFFICNKKANLKMVDNNLRKGNLRVTSKVVNNVIVSLTSYGERIPELRYTLYSLIMQSVRPEKIIVNLSFEDEKYINKELKFFEQYGVEFYLCKNMRSYTKLLPTLIRFKKSIIVTADDDIYYGKKWLEKLLIAHEKNPNDVCCHLVYGITHNEDNINGYKKWNHKFKSKGINSHNFLLGVGGVLYPPNVFYKDVLNEELFMKLSPLADDIWFYFMVILKGTKIIRINKPLKNLCFVNPYREYGIIEGATLTQQNVGENKNDTQFKAILDYYNITEKKFIKFLEDNYENRILDC